MTAESEPYCRISTRVGHAPFHHHDRTRARDTERFGSSWSGDRSSRVGIRPRSRPSPRGRLVLRNLAERHRVTRRGAAEHVRWGALGGDRDPVPARTRAAVRVAHGARHGDLVVPPRQPDTARDRRRRRQAGRGHDTCSWTGHFGRPDPQMVVPPCAWQRARPMEDEAGLVSCIVVPASTSQTSASKARSIRCRRRRSSEGVGTSPPPQEDIARSPVGGSTTILATSRPPRCGQNPPAASSPAIRSRRARQESPSRRSRPPGPSCRSAR